MSYSVQKQTSSSLWTSLGRYRHTLVPCTVRQGPIHPPGNVSPSSTTVTVTSSMLRSTHPLGGRARLHVNRAAARSRDVTSHIETRSNRGHAHTCAPITTRHASLKYHMSAYFTRDAAQRAHDRYMVHDVKMTSPLIYNAQFTSIRMT